jgi:hypothetical protein
LVKRITDLNPKAQEYAAHCLDTYTLQSLVEYGTQGIDHEACSQWGISGDQWQDAIFAVLEEFRATRESSL